MLEALIAGNEEKTNITNAQIKGGSQYLTNLFLLVSIFNTSKIITLFSAS